jgi:hypothetical protein
MTQAWESKLSQSERPIASNVINLASGPASIALATPQFKTCMQQRVSAKYPSYRFVVIDH